MKPPKQRSTLLEKILLIRKSVVLLEKKIENFIRKKTHWNTFCTEDSKEKPTRA